MADLLCCSDSQSTRRHGPHPTQLRNLFTYLQRQGTGHDFESGNELKLSPVLLTVCLPCTVALISGVTTVNLSPHLCTGASSVDTNILALEFDPDRFLDERVKYLTLNPFIFLPFNAGPRICLGQQVRFQVY